VPNPPDFRLFLLAFQCLRGPTSGWSQGFEVRGRNQHLFPIQRSAAIGNAECSSRRHWECLGQMGCQKEKWRRSIGKSIWRVWQDWCQPQAIAWSNISHQWQIVSSREDIMLVSKIFGIVLRGSWCDDESLRSTPSYVEVLHFNNGSKLLWMWLPTENFGRIISSIWRGCILVDWWFESSLAQACTYRWVEWTPSF
jgi:hypothetical protein